MQLKFAENNGLASNHASHDLLVLDEDASSLFHNQMQMFAHASNSDNAFVYLISEKQFLSVGNSTHIETLDFEALLQHILTLNSSFVILDKQINDIYTQDKPIVLALTSHENNSPLALIGSKLDHTNKPISKQTIEMLKLIASQFEIENRLRQKVIQTRELDERHMQISELNQDYICVKDINHHIVYANQAMLDTFPVKFRPMILGSTSFEYYEPEISAQMIDSDLQALKDGLYSKNQHMIFANGEEKILHVTKKAFSASDGNTYLMSVSRDVTEKEILINDLKRSNSDLDNFAYVASHDLRSPLNVIKRLVSWVAEDCADILPPDSKDNLELTLNRVARMEKLLVDLLSYSRIGKDYQESSKTNLRELVVELLSLLDLPMGFVVNCDNVDIHVPVVPFNVVMLNLVSNAIKHHDSGNAKIQIKAKVTKRASIISIEDNGPGIAEKNKERIFQLFETLKPRDEVEGSGMGLSVVKKIVEHYGGSIKVSDNLPRGTKFEINWPITNLARPILANVNK
ncbi:PAS domain-containing sensor histidine kinase [Glaciecola petra]|uniref:histidine kinase n=1 Tax=Glaciecola petra TaxID=3075602 RepID=A0ABU2ZU19_9ALTE|nr:HAMP domain-containing sensor histidine kinase [Aestuariibacter sp. P117]MDT0596142.1 HAMP domain-containing sensor histidine kinase [Aestuariibacter sp. P117]